MRQDWCAAFVIGAAIAVTGCARPTTIVVTGLQTANTLPSSGAVHTHSDLAYGGPDQAPLAVVYLAGPGNLEELAQAWTDHLYFELISCTDRRDSALLFNGTVFKANSKEIKQPRKLGGGEDAAQYKVYIPLQPQYLVNDNKIYGPFDVKTYRESARSGGVCLRLRGGNMAGFGLRSNVVRVPLKVRADGGLTIASGSSGTK